MAEYIRQIWACRWFWYSLVRMDLRSRYRGSIMGMGWSLLNPIAMTVIFCTVFATLLNQDIHFYAPYVMAGIAVWNFLLQCTLEGCQCFLRAESYIRQYPAPMAIYPLRNTLYHGFHLVLASLLVVILTVVLRGWPGILPIFSVLASLPVFLVTGWAVSVVFGLANIHFRDTRHLCEIGFQILFYLTPIMYPSSLLMERGLGWLVRLNPVVPFLDLIRIPMLEGRVADPLTWGLALGISALFSLAAGLALRAREDKVILHL